MHIFNNRISLDRYISFLIALYPIAYALGNTIINLVTVLIIIIGLIAYKKKIFFSNHKSLVILTFLFFLYIICITFINNYPKINLLEDHLINIKKSFLFLRYFLLFLIINYICEKRLINLKYLYFTSAFITLFLCLDIFYQFVFGEDIFGLVGTTRHYTGFFGSELVAGSFIQKFSLFLILIFFAFKTNFTKYKKIFLLLTLIVITAIAIILAGNRMPVVVYFCSLIAVSFLAKKFRKLFLLMFLTAAIVIVFLYKNFENTKSDYGALARDSSEIISVFPKIVLGKEIPPIIESWHLKTFHGALLTWTNKISGDGMRSLRVNCPQEDFNKIRNTLGHDRMCNWHPHNYYLEILIDLGFVGLLLFMVIFYTPVLFSLKEFLFSKKSNAGLIIILPFFIILIFELFPLKTTGSFFSTNNATFIFLALAIIINLKEFRKF
jgi:O-antigen ligase